MSTPPPTLPKPHKGQVGHIYINGKCTCGATNKKEQA